MGESGERVLQADGTAGVKIGRMGTSWPDKRDGKREGRPPWKKELYDLECL